MRESLSVPRNLIDFCERQQILFVCFDKTNNPKSDAFTKAIVDRVYPKNI